MNYRYWACVLVALGAFGVIGCSSQRIFYAKSDLQDDMGVQKVIAKQDQYGIMHVEVDLVPTTSKDQYVDAYITFTRQGVFIEKLGPKPIIIHGGPIPDSIIFNSTQPADDYKISFDYSQ